MDEFITIARITRPRGVNGEVTAQILTDFPERFCAVGRVRLLCDAKIQWEEVESYRFHQNRVLLRFLGFESADEAASLAGCEVQVPEEEAVTLPPGVYFHFQLMGCNVFEGGSPLGRVVEVLDTGRSANLVVRTREGADFMIPLAHRFVRRVDVTSSCIHVELPEGLLELALPPPHKRTRRAGPGR